MAEDIISRIARNIANCRIAMRVAFDAGGSTLGGLAEIDSTGVLSSEQIEEAVKDFHINDYGRFKRIHKDEWICSPRNRNADIPDIFIRLEGDTAVCGYYFTNDDNDERRYRGTPQEGAAGLVIELAKIKNDVEAFVVEARNDAQKRVDKEKEKASDHPEESPGQAYGGDTDDDGGMNSEMDLG